MKKFHRIKFLPLLLLLLLLLPASSVLGHEFKITALGKAVTVYDIPTVLGDPLFNQLQAIATQVENEITDELAQVNKYGAHLDELEELIVDPNAYVALEASSGLAFGLGGRFLGFDLRAKFTCPYLTYGQCKAIYVDAYLSHVEAFGQIDFFNGNGSLVVQPHYLDIKVDVDTTLLGSVNAWLLDFIAGLNEDDLVPIVEDAIEDDLIPVKIEAIFTGLADVLDNAPSFVETAIGFIPIDHLESPFEGLTLEISFIAPTGSQNSGKVDMVISHRKISSLTGSVASVSGSEKPRLSWASVPNASQYRIYSKPNNLSYWEDRGTTSSTQWTDMQFYGGSGSSIEANNSAGSQSITYYVVTENILGVQSRPSNLVPFAITTGGGPGAW